MWEILQRTLGVRRRAYTRPAMPTYQYACRVCGHRFEAVQSMSDPPLTACPECGGELRKVYAPPAIAFKGSGFYATDHGKKKAPSAVDGGSKADGGSTGDGKSAPQGAEGGAKRAKTATDPKPSPGKTPSSAGGGGSTPSAGGDG